MRFGVTYALVVVGFATSAVAQDVPKPAAHRAPNLFASTQGALAANRVLCGLTAAGRLCGGFSPVSGAGFWPNGSPNQYIFSSGLHVAGLIPAAAGFAWAGDTVGAYLFDLRGVAIASEALSLLFSSRDTADIRIWPSGAFVNDTTAFHALYLGRQAVADQDVWSRYWDGNPRVNSGRTHPMGVVIDQRAVAWNYPEWNRDVVYFVLTVTNITARNPAAYANPTVPAAIRSELAALGARFQDSSETLLGVAIPDGGYALDSVYLGLVMDPDIADPGSNNATAVLPFGTALAYKSNFAEPLWSYPPEINGQPPFTAAPGLVGARFLRHPGPLAMWNVFTGSSSGFPDPVGVRQLWRYLSGNTSPTAGDNPCVVANPQIRKFCFFDQTDRDVRFMMSQGPFSLPAGESRTIVLAYLFAAPLDTVNAYTSTRMLPGVPYTGDSIAADPAKIRPIDRAAGWRTQADVNGNRIIEANEVVTAPRSLLHKAQLAQALADARFLLPQPPAAPRFFLVPGDRRVTVVWQPSATETAGDPYFAIASDRTSPLYDPNFRRNDVEGYRLYRGTRPDHLELVAQFDYDGTEMRDYTGNFAYSGRCAPEIGVIDDCPVPFGTTPDSTVFTTRDLSFRMIQVPPGARIESTNGTIVTLSADTVGGAGGAPTLANSGVPFTYVDSSVNNSFDYYYAVTAFDVNSIRSGPGSFESPGVAQHVKPRVASGQTSGAVAPVVTILGRDGVPLDPAAPLPALNAATGVFGGPMPPTNGIEVAFAAFQPEILGTDSAIVTIDSIIPGAASFALPATYYLRMVGSAGVQSLAVPVPVDFFSSSQFAQGSALAVATDSAQAGRFGADTTFRMPVTVSLLSAGAWRLTSWGRASANFDPSNADQNGPRWWSGSANENTPAPNELVCTPASGFCVQGNLSRNAGSLPLIDTLFHLQSYSTVPNTPMRDLEGIGATVARAADFRVYWGAGGTIDSVVDVTHHTRVPYHAEMRASWGVLFDSSFVLAGTNQAATADGNNNLITWSDALCVAPAPRLLNQCGGAAQTPPRLLDRARLSPVSARSSTYAGTNSLPVTGTGFMFYLNGHFFLMQGALPAQGTVWNARFYAGIITGTAAAANYSFTSTVRPPAVPGLRARIAFAGSRLDASHTTDSLLALVHTVPDPYYGTSAYEATPDTQRLAFIHLPAQAIIRIYSVSGILVAVLMHNDATGGGEAFWDLKSRTGKRVASGVYFYHIETPDRHRKIGRFTIVNGPGR